MVYPVKYPRVNASFGVRGSWSAGYHTGIDYDTGHGTTIYATKAGTVVHSGYGGTRGWEYGNHVVIRSWHVWRYIEHIYAHLSRAQVFYGQKVETGQIVGYSGSTGRVTGPHLHYEERHYPYGYYNHHNPVLPDWEPAPPKPRIKLRNLKPGKRNNHVRKLKKRLNKEFPGERKMWGRKFNPVLRDRYRRYQRRLGYTGADADGIPGKASLEKLGFKVLP